MTKSDSSEKNDQKTEPPSGLKRRSLRFWREWVKPLLVVLIVLGSFRSSVADWNDVPTGSMKPTILEGDRIVVNKLAYDLKVPFVGWRLVKWSAPRRGDVVICFSPATGIRLVKRVVGLPGDRVELRNHRLIINGEPIEYGPLDGRYVEPLSERERQRYKLAEEQILDRPHPVMAADGASLQQSFAPVTVPDEHYFVMGDNRDNSIDSRSFGGVRRDLIVGRAFAVALSLDRDNHYLPRWRRFFSELP